VLREVFGFSHAEIAETLDRSEASVRQVAHRARQHVAERRSRFSTDREERRRVTEEFLSATMGGDLDRLLAVLAPDVVLVSDGGGKRTAARRPLVGAADIGRFMARIGQRPYDGVAIEDMTVRMADINGAPGVVVEGGGMVLTAMVAEVADGLVHRVHLIANPDKLHAIGEDRTVTLVR
jgi:ketosteroid isomerase-like protein